jgi:predicted Zn-dependent protease
MALLFLKFSRADESQADQLGFRYATKGRYDMREGIQVMETLSRISKAEGGGKTPDWLQTHPNPDNRVKVLQEDVAKVPSWQGTKIDRAQLLAVVNGLVYGENPRQGFVQNDRFYAPDLGIQVDFPKGWKIQNQPSAVVAQSPQGDAAIQLTVAQASPAQAAQQFASQQGVQTKPWSGKCGSDVGSGTCVAFQAQTQQGPLSGVAGFIGDQGKTIAIAAFAPAQATQARAPELEGSLTSVHRLTDPRAQSVQPAKVEVVTVPEPMTLEQFNSKYPSTIPLTELAIANGIQPKDALSPGAQLKRVTGGPPANESAAYGK